MRTIDEVATFVHEKGIEFFLCSFVEMTGAPKAKVVPVQHLEDMAQGSAGFAGFAAGLDGIKKKISAGKRNDRNLYQVSPTELEAEGIGVLPSTLHEALDELEKDNVILDALGREYAQCYIRAKRAEWKAYHDSVSQWEIDNYLGLY